MTETQNTPSAAFDFFDYFGIQAELDAKIAKDLRSIKWCTRFAELHHDDFLREGLIMQLDISDADRIWIRPIKYDKDKAWGFGKFKDFVELIATPAMGSQPDNPPYFGGNIGDEPSYLCCDWEGTEERPMVSILIGNVITTGCVAEIKMVKQVTWKCGGDQ